MASSSSGGSLTNTGLASSRPSTSLTSNTNPTSVGSDSNKFQLAAFLPVLGSNSASTSQAAKAAPTSTETSITTTAKTTTVTPTKTPNPVLPTPATSTPATPTPAAPTPAAPAPAVPAPTTPATSAPTILASDTPASASTTPAAPTSTASTSTTSTSTTSTSTAPAPTAPVPAPAPAAVAPAVPTPETSTPGTPTSTAPVPEDPTSAAPSPVTPTPPAPILAAGPKVPTTTTSTTTSTSTSTSTPATKRTPTGLPTKLSLIPIASSTSTITSAIATNSLHSDTNGPASNPGPSDVSATSANAMDGRGDSALPASSRTATILGGVLGGVVIAVLLVGLLIYRRRKRNQSFNHGGFEHSTRPSSDMEGHPPSNSLAEAGSVPVFAAVSAVSAVGQSKRQTNYYDYSSDPYYSGPNDADYPMGITSDATTAVNMTQAYHASPPPPVPSHTALTSVDRSMPGFEFGSAVGTTAAAAAATTTTTTAAANQHYESYDNRPVSLQSRGISKPLWSPQQYEGSSPMDGEHAYRGSNESDCGASVLEIELEIEPKATTTPTRNFSKLSTVVEAASPSSDPTSPATVEPSSQPQSNEKNGLRSIPMVRIQFENDKSYTDDLSDIVSLRMNNGAESGDNGRPSHPVFSDFQLPAIEENEPESSMVRDRTSTRPDTFVLPMIDESKPALGLGIPVSHSNTSLSQDTDRESRAMSSYSDDTRASFMASATRLRGQRAPSFVDRDSAFFPGEGS